MATFTLDDRPPLVGREDELQRLLAAVHASSEGRPAVVLLGGDAGVGKTRLIAQVVADSPEALVVRGGCVDLGDVGLPYLPFVEAFSDLARQHPSATDIPGLAPLLPSTQAPGGELVRLQLFEAVVASLRAAGEIAPVLLVLEDLHWADASSRELLRFLVARLREERVTVLASYRADDLHRRHPLVPLISELSRLGGVEHVVLQPLADDAVRRHLGAVRQLAEPVLAEVVRRAEGNAYFAEELALAASDGHGLPTQLSEVLLTRIERLDPVTLGLVRLAAVAGRRVDHGLLAAASGLAGIDADTALRDAVAAHVLVVVRDTASYSFRHALLQETVYDDLLPGERVRLHGLLAQVLDEVGGDPGELAWHKQRSGDLVGAFHDYVRAGTQAMADGAPHEAMAYREHALALAAAPSVEVSLVDRLTLLRGTAKSAGLAGDWGRATALSRETLPLAEQLGVAEQSDAHRITAMHLLEGDSEAEALAEATLARDLALESGDLTRIARAQNLYARAVWHRLDRDDEVASAAEAALEAAGQVGLEEVQADALVTLGMLDEASGDLPRALERFRAARERAVRSDNLPQELRAAFQVASHSFYLGDFPTAEREARETVGRAAAEGLGWSPYGYSVHSLLSVILYQQGDLAASTAAGLGARGGSGDPARDSLAAIGLYAAVARGDADAVPTAERFLSAGHVDPLAWLVAGGTASDALRMRGEPSQASAIAARATARVAERWGDWSLGGIWLAALGIAAEADLATAARHRKDTAAEQAAVVRATAWERDAQETAKRGRPRGGALGPEGRAWLLRGTAELRRAEGVPDVELWGRVVAEFDYGYVYEVARSRWRLAEALVETGDREAAASELRSALAVAVGIGAQPFRADVLDLARRARLDVGARLPSVTVLTDRELEVLRLVATGHTNRQIGTQLFISEKTASVHVSRIMARLEVSGRAEAAAKGTQLGLLA